MSENMSTSTSYEKVSPSFTREGSPVACLLYDIGCMNGSRSFKLLE